MRREEIDVEYEALPFVLDAEEALEAGSPLVHQAHGSNVLLDKTFVWGEVDKDFAASPRKLSLRVKWGRSSTVPIETFGVVASWDPWRDMLDVYASIQMPRYADQIGMALKIPVTSVRVHYDVDVGGSYGVKRGIKHTVLAGYLSRRLGVPVRLIEDRLENMRGGDAHGPERLFDVDVAFDDTGVIKSMKMRALENVGAYAGRSPFQLGKPIGAIVGPYKINSVRYRAMAVVTNKTTQEAVRGFGQAPTNLALERVMDEVANALGLDPIEIRRRNLIKRDEFPYLIPSGTTYDSGDYFAVIGKVLAGGAYEALKAERDALRAKGQLAGIGVSACLEPSGGNATFEALLNPAITTSTFMDSCRISVDGMGSITATMHTTSSGQGHETLVGTVIGEVLQLDPDLVRVTRADSLNSLPSGTPVGSRMAIMLGGAAFHARHQAQGEIDGDRRARPRHSAGARGLRPGPGARPQRAGAQAHLGRSGADRVPQFPPHAAGHAARPVGRPRLSGADRRRAADRRRPRADVSLLLVRIPSAAGRHRSRARPAANIALPARPRLRHPDQSEDRARHGPWAASPTASARRCTRNSPITMTAN